MRLLSHARDYCMHPEAWMRAPTHFCMYSHRMCLPFSWVIMVIRKAKYMILGFITAWKNNKHTHTLYNNSIACGHKILTNKTTVVVFFAQTRASNRVRDEEKKRSHSVYKTLHMVYCKCLLYYCHDVWNAFEQL